MASAGKRKTTMAKLTRERRLRERRMEKDARKQARKLRAADPQAQLEDQPYDPWAEPDRSAESDHQAESEHQAESDQSAGGPVASDS
ncbi:MAG TPA: hypothetical protein VGY32_01590 [Solirubrobacteraceae bacterium]|jgi:hypothetical protein|nr:hypothetical protein [Solirubrobacteraceae bacterium]